jgi:sensor histidine kinase regulating citrate/malate metabolism
MDNEDNKSIFEEWWFWLIVIVVVIVIILAIIGVVIATTKKKSLYGDEVDEIVAQTEKRESEMLSSAL